MSRTAFFVGPVVFLACCAAGCLVTLPAPTQAEPGDGAARDVFFCFWNVENFFDDKLDGYKSEPDGDYDKWFAENAAVGKQKLENLCKVLLDMNDGKGPDILAFCEVESGRAAELLKDALNARLKDEKLHYTEVLFKEPKNLGRHINAGVLTRLPAALGKTQALGNRQRMLRTVLKVNGHELVVVASHWTSRISDEDGAARTRYGDTIFKDFENTWKANKGVDYIVCGDFNDEPRDKSVLEGLYAVGEPKKVKNAKEAVFLNLTAKLQDGEHATHVYRSKPYVFDNIAVSPGLLDGAGWAADPDSIAIATKLMGQKVRGKDFLGPKRFGDDGDGTLLAIRGYSDHFPVTVRLKVAAAE